MYFLLFLINLSNFWTCSNIGKVCDHGKYKAWESFFIQNIPSARFKPVSLEIKIKLGVWSNEYLYLLIISF